MKSTSIDLDLLENALLAIERVLAHADSELLREAPHSELALELPLMPLEFERDVSESEAERFRGSAAHAALNICLSAAAALVDVSKTLLHAPGDRTPEDLAREWEALITHTRIASRSAHRAALLLAEQEDALSARGIDAVPSSDLRSLSFAH